MPIKQMFPPLKKKLDDALRDTGETGETGEIVETRRQGDSEIKLKNFYKTLN